MPGDRTMLPTEGADDAPESEYVPTPPEEPETDPDDEVVHAGGMTRRKAVVLGSAIVLLALGLLVAFAIVLGTQTPFGRDYIRSIVLDLTKGMKGRLYIGRIEGNLFTGVRIDSLELRDTQDSVFIATGPISVTYDPRDFLDRRVLLRHVRVERPIVVIKKHEDGTWNYRRLFPGKPSSPRRERGFGDFIRVDSADVVDMRFVLTMPWHPADSLRGARRDSAIRATLSDSAHCTPARCWSETRRDAEGLKRTWRWTNADVALGHVRIADPDTAGRYFRIATLGVDEADPPFRFRNVRGDVRMLKDTAWLELSHFDLPGSTGSARGRVEWGDIETGEPGSAFGRKGCRPMPGKLSCPVRYDIAVQGDSVSLADVAWVYPTLPTTGGGRMRLRIRSDTANLNVIDYAISDMDVRSTFSRLRGRMTYGVGGPVLVVKDVAVDASPVDFRLIRQLNGEDFPYPWAGTITGRVVGRGGPLTRFRVDSAHFTFADANVPGARTIGSARGELDILFPAFTAFHGFDVTVDQLDLRTLQFLNPNFPRINGFVAGRATLDSSWLDVRFRDADMTHVDGPGEPSRATGSGRVTYGEQFMTWDLTIDAQPLSFATLARSYPELPVRASFRGPLRVQGTSEDLDLQADLSGAAGRIVVDGNFDTYPPGFAARATGRVDGLDPRLLLDRADMPEGSITARFESDLRGDTITNLDGRLVLDVERSLLAGVRVYGGTARLAFAPGHLRVDTLALETAVATLGAHGGLGLVPGRRDSIAFTLGADSLGGLRRWIAPTVDGEAPDTLAGIVRVAGTLAGTLDTLALRAELAGEGLQVARTRVLHLTGDVALDGLPAAPRGRFGLAMDTLIVGGTTITRAVLAADVVDAERTRFAAGAVARNGARLEVGGESRVSGDTTRVRFDSLALAAGPDRWSLAAPAQLLMQPGLVALDALRLAREGGGSLAVEAVLPESGAIRGTLRAERLPLGTVGVLAQAEVPYRGSLDAEVALAGTREALRIDASATLDAPAFGSVTLERVTADARYADRAASANVALYRGGQAVLTATGNVPMNLALRPVAQRIANDAPIVANVRSDSVSLGLLESLSPQIQQAEGTFTANLDVRGTWSQPALRGRATVDRGAVTLANIGVRLVRIGADVEFQGDTLAIRQLAAETGGDRPGRVAVTGGVNFADLEDPTFDLRLTARDFLAINRPRVARIELSTFGSRGLQLVGSWRGATLSGGLEVSRGEIYIPEFAEKRVVSLDDPEFYRIVDTSLFTNRRLLPNAPSELVRNLAIEGVQLRMGQDVWLRSAEANINLAGAVDVTSGRDPRDPRRAQLALRGSIAAVRGTYRLDLGPLQRTFAVEQGTLAFYGDPDLNPALDIRAIHVVRQQNYNRADVPVRVIIGGTLAQPTLTLESADQIARSQSDLISYLITGQPSFDEAFATTDAALSTAANLLFTTGGSLLGSRLTALDYFQLESSGSSELVKSSLRGGVGNFGGLFSSTRLAAGEQLTDRTFLSFSYGLCNAGQWFGSNSSVRLDNELQNIGARLDYRLSRTWTLSGSSEPATTALTCDASGTGRGTVLTTPRQWGLDFSKKWEF